MSHTPPGVFAKPVGAILALGCCGCLGIVPALAEDTIIIAPGKRLVTLFRPATVLSLIEFLPKLLASPMTISGSSCSSFNIRPGRCHAAKSSSQFSDSSLSPVVQVISVAGIDDSFGIDDPLSGSGPANSGLERP